MTKFFSFLSFSSLFFGVGGLNYQRRTYLKEHKWLRNLALRHREKHFYGKEPSWVCYTRIGSEIWETQMERNIWIFLERDRVRERETEKRSVSNLFTQKAKVFFFFFLCFGFGDLFKASGRFLYFSCVNHISCPNL